MALVKKLLPFFRNMQYESHKVYWVIRSNSLLYLPFDATAIGQAVYEVNESHDFNFFRCNRFMKNEKNINVMRLWHFTIGSTLCICIRLL